MSGNLNERLFARFGLEYPTKRIKDGFRSEVRKTLQANIDEVLHPSSYEDENKWWDIQSIILEKVCRNLFLDSGTFHGSEFSSGLNEWVREELSNSAPFEEFLLKLQVLLDAIYDQPEYRKESSDITSMIEEYMADFPVLGLTIKKYKKRAAQIFPANTKQFDEKVKNTLDLLDVRDEYNEILEHYEAGIRELLSAKGKTQLKDAIEDMYTACDLAVSLAFGNTKLGLRHLFKDGRGAKIGLNEWQIQIFDQMRDWMDKIKHGAQKEYSFSDTEMIVLLASEFIRYLLNHQSKL